MGDRTSVTITVKGISGAYWRRIEEHLVDQWSADGTWGGDPEESGGSWIIQEMSLGSAAEVGEGLRRLMEDLDELFAYRIDEDPKYEYDGYWEGWIPDGTDDGWSAAGEIDGGGDLHVSVREVDRVIDEFLAGQDGLATFNMDRLLRFEDPVPPADALIAGLRKLTNHGWRQAWDALDEPLPEPEPDHGTFVVTI